MLKDQCQPLIAAAVLMLAIMPTHTWAQTAGSKRQNAQFDPARYVRIVEESGADRILLHDSSQTFSGSTILRVDADSKIVIELDESKMGPDLALNQLFMEAHLNRTSEGNSFV